LRQQKNIPEFIQFKVASRDLVIVVAVVFPSLVVVAATVMVGANEKIIKLSPSLDPSIPSQTTHT